MSQVSLEDRVAVLERAVEQLKHGGRGGSEDQPWWRSAVGAFADDPLFEEAVQAGAEYRSSLRPRDPEPR